MRSCAQDYLIIIILTLYVYASFKRFVMMFRFPIPLFSCLTSSSFAFCCGPGPHGARNRDPPAIRRQATAAYRDGRRLQPLSLGLARLQTGERRGGSCLVVEGGTPHFWTERLFDYGRWFCRFMTNGVWSINKGKRTTLLRTLNSFFSHSLCCGCDWFIQTNETCFPVLCSLCDLSHGLSWVGKTKRAFIK